MNRNNIKYLAGTDKMDIRPLPIYSELVCDFLDELSKALRKNAAAKAFPDILTFAFWCRKSNIIRLKEAYPFLQNHIGRGMVFHIAPSNVPINFAYTLVFGMLAGNANVVRVSEKGFEQIEIVCSELNVLLQEDKYKLLAGQTQVVSYGHDAEINEFYSKMCDVRVIWGGDATIHEVRKAPLKPRAVEVTFADRYSFALFDEKEIQKLSDEELAELAGKFYNDTYLMDQNACSSPHLILWLHADGMAEGRKRFWNALSQTAKKYDLPEKKVMDKYTMLCEKAAEYNFDAVLEQYGNLLYVVSLQELPDNIEKWRGRFGLFYETDIDEIENVCSRLTEKVQTCVIYGVTAEKVAECLVENHAGGVDRIVPVGQAMDIGVYWDGYDVIGHLSRGIMTME